MIREKMETRRQNIRARHRRKILLSAMCFFVAIVFVGLYVGFNFSFTHKPDSKGKPAETSATVLPTLQKNMNIMLLGVDERNDDVGRSDTLMFLNLSGDKVSLLSIPRDTRVYIDRHGYEKINAAYAHGG